MIITIARQCGCMGDEIGQNDLLMSMDLHLLIRNILLSLLRKKGYMINSLISSPRYR